MKESYLRQIGQVSMITVFFFKKKYREKSSPDPTLIIPRFKILLERRKLSFYHKRIFVK